MDPVRGHVRPRLKVLLVDAGLDWLSPPAPAERHDFEHNDPVPLLELTSAATETGKESSLAGLISCHHATAARSRIET